MKLLLLALGLLLTAACVYRYKSKLSWYVLNWWYFESYKPKKTSAFPDELRSAPLAHEKPIVIIIPSYNNARWCARNLDSVCMQKYTNYRIIYINDVSPDETSTLVQNYIATHNLAHKITFIDNEQRRGALANIYHAVHSCADNEIIVTLDGDDWFTHDTVLQKINTAYADDIWLAYGQYEDYPLKRIGICAEIPQSIIHNNAYRSYTWVSSHPRTFYAWLFKKIKTTDLQNTDGSFFATSWDMAFMFPMLEMAGKHTRFINEILYEYNIVNPLNDYRVRAQEQHATADYIRAQPAYQPLSEAPMHMPDAAKSHYTHKSV